MEYSKSTAMIALAVLAADLLVASSHQDRTRDLLAGDAPQDDVADIPSQDLKIKNEPNMRYFLIGPKKDVAEPANGFSLVVILPGGDGSAEFHPFVKRIYKNAMSDNYLVAQPVAVKWTEQQAIVWPTEKTKVEKMKVSTEQFVEAILEDVGKKHKLDPECLFSLSWSSSGPAAYAMSMSKKKRLTGSLIAMSVFKPDLLGLVEAKGHAYYLLHSKEDKVCAFRFAEQAQDALKKAEAKVELATYDGGHGWHGDVYGNIRSGFEWLEKNHAPPPKK
jgi:predicted esterase